jgi:hypothetical protein
MFTKRKLKAEIVRLTYRVADLEERICPCESHDWLRVETDLRYIGCGEMLPMYRYKYRVCGKQKEDIV